MFLGLDLGTSGLKGVLVDGDRVVAQATAPLTVRRAEEGWSEQDPDDWIAAAEAVIAELRTASGWDGLAGIGLSGQMHGSVCLGADDRPVAPAILWNDTRAAAEAAALDGPEARAISANIVFPGFTAPKLMWMRAQRPDAFAATRCVMLPKDYLGLWLTGARASEMSDASGTAWLDVGARAWSPRLLELSGMRPDQMPPLVEGSAPRGALRADLAAAWGVRAVPVAGGGGDNAASAVGMGVVRAGTAFASLGTSGVLFAATDAHLPNPESAVHAFCHALPGTWHQMGVILAATDALNWWAGICGADAASLAAEVPDGPGRVRFLPYLGGERTPHNDAAIRAGFSGLSHAASRADLTRAVLEGVACAFADCKAALAAAGTELDRVLAVGGGAQSDKWLSILAGVLEVPLEVPQDASVGAALGAARLGRMAAGQGTDAPMPAIARTVAPAHDYAETRAAYAALTAALRTQ